MTSKDQKRIARELCKSYRERLEKNVAKFPPDWNGHQIRALFAYLSEAEQSRKTLRKMMHSEHWWNLPL